MMAVAWKAGGKSVSRVQRNMTQEIAEDFPCDRLTLDRITVMIDHLAREFDVPYRSAALRAVGLGIISQEQWDEIKRIAREEAVFRELSKP